MIAPRTAAVALVTIVLSSIAGVSSPGRASAETILEFYTSPGQFDPAPGAVVRTEPMQILAAPSAQTGFPIPAQRVMYTSRTEADEPVAVTGTFIDTANPWRGAGPRPTVIVAPGTVGQGDQCAPSLAFSTGIYATTTPPSLSANQELVSASAWTSLGARVFVTDYIGLGTPGVHTYVNRKEEAHAVLDAARAANRLSGGGPATPLAIWGYSQGGGAAAAAAELQPSYAPELNLKGTWAGAPPADLLQVLTKIDGNLIGGAIGFAINGFVARHPELEKPLNERVTPEGRAVLRSLRDECIGDIIVRQPFFRTSQFTEDHRSMLENLATIPEARPIFDAQKLGTLRPATPVLITSGRNDDTVPYEQARQLATTWCDKGAAVAFRTNDLPPILPGTTFGNHFGPELIDGYGTDNAVS